MSSYRDDSNEIVFVGDELTVFVNQRADTAAKAGDSLAYRLRVRVEDSVAVGEQWKDHGRTPAADGVALGEVWVGAVRSKSSTADARKVTESFQLATRAIHQEASAVADDLIGKVRSKGQDAVAATEEWTGLRRVRSFITDGVAVADRSIRRARFDMVDVVVSGDEHKGKMRATMLLTDSLSAQAAEKIAADTGIKIIESLFVSDSMTGRLRARQMVVDGAQASDEQARDEGQTAQAWTANVRNWATTRYAPYTFESIAVIDGVAYATTPDGVYALSGGDEDMQARMQSGKLDMSGGELVHPVSVYMEYELTGTASLDVTTTQTGAAKTYTYQLPPEPAQELTNGRFILGKGLRGRHFSMALMLKGKRARINDMKVYVESTKRRV